MKNAKQLRLPDTESEEEKLEPPEGLPAEHEHYLDHIAGQEDPEATEPARGRTMDDDEPVPEDEGETEDDEQDHIRKR